MDEIKGRQELLLEIEQLKLDNARLGQRMDKMRKWNNSLLQKNWQESEDQTLLKFSEQKSEVPTPKELLQELRIHQEELRVQNEELLEIRYSLEESRSRYQALFRNSPLPCLILNESSRILELNHQAAKLLAQANPDLHPERMPMSLFLHRYSQENFRHFFVRVLQSSEAQREEWKLRDEQIVVAHGFALAPIEDGRIEGCQVVFENVTLQRQEELQKLQEREYRLLQAQQMARLGDWQWEEGQIFCSPHLFTLLQIHPSTGPTNFFQAYLEHVPENDQKKVRSQWQQAIEKGKSFTLNHYYLLPNGCCIQLRVQGSPVHRTGTQRYLGFIQVIESQEKNQPTKTS